MIPIRIAVALLCLSPVAIRAYSIKPITIPAPKPIEAVPLVDTTLHINGQTTSELRESVRRARQAVDDINIDITVIDSDGGFNI